MKVEVGQYFPIKNGGALKASFTLVEYPEGRKTLDCKYFEQGDKKWFAFPSKEKKFDDGRKTEYIPYISYLNKEYLQQLQKDVLEALKTATPTEKHGQAQSNSARNQPSKLPSESSTDYGQPPF